MGGDGVEEVDDDDVKMGEGTLSNEAVDDGDDEDEAENETDDGAAVSDNSSADIQSIRD